MLCDESVTVVNDETGESLRAQCTMRDSHAGKCLATMSSEYGLRVQVLWDPEEFVEDLTR